MAKKCNFASRAWKLMHLALIWARKGGLFRRRLSVDLQFLPDSFRTLRASDSNPYGEHEFSFVETPIFNFKGNKPRKQARYLPCIPCVNPHIKFDVYGDDGDNGRDDGGDGSHDDDDDDDGGGGGIKPRVLIEEEGVDSKAEEFIARFYQQMRLQRQVSYLQYKEMLHRGMN